MSEVSRLRRATSFQEALREYRTQRSRLQLLTDIRATVELARKEVSLTGDVLTRIEGATERYRAEGGR